MKVLLDTNVILDYSLELREHHYDAFCLINLLSENNDNILVSANVVNDYFYLITTYVKKIYKLKGKQANMLAWSFFDNIKEIVGFVGCDESDIFIAKKMRNKNDDLEDNLVVAAAIRADANYLVTNDKNLLKKQLVPTKTPKQIIELLNKKK